jgi:ParB family transcriptional regulator, chromosome partitioning protein
MRLEFHQLDRPWEHLRVREPHRRAHLLASLAERGQQSPIIVVVAAGCPGRYVVIDGYARIAALEQLKRDTVEATVWEMNEAEAVLLDRGLHYRQQETALEQGWLLAELQRRFGYSLEELAQRFDRSTSWVSRRLALAEVLPEAIQQYIREGRIGAQLALKYLVPAARISREDSKQLAAAFIHCHCDTRQAGQLYAGWKSGSRAVRERILTGPALYLKTQRQAPAPAKTPASSLERDVGMAVAILERAGRQVAVALTEMNGPQLDQLQRQLAKAQRELENIQQQTEKERELRHAEPSRTDGNSGTEGQASGRARDRARVAVVAIERAQGVEGEFHRGAGDRAGGESRALPPTDSRVMGGVQGEPRASP